MKLLIFGGGFYPLNMGRVISIKYGEGKGGWSTKVCRKTDGFGLWRSISEGWESFSMHFSFVVGDGTWILF